MADDTATGKREKRRHHRPMAGLDVKVLLGEAGENLSDVKLATIDVAAGGMRCASNVRFEPKTCLHMGLTLVGGELRNPATIYADARVLRCSERPGSPDIRRYEIALEFVRLVPEDRKKLESYLNSL